MMEPVSIALGLAQVIPGVVRWLAGDDAADVANKVLDIAKGVAGVEDTSQAVSAIRSDPALQAQLQQAWWQHERAMFEAETERLRVRLADTDSARRMHVDVKSRMPAILAAAIIFLFIGEMVALFAGMMPSDEASKTAIIKGVSLLETAFSLMLGFYYGSSAGSANKDRLLAGR